MRYVAVPATLLTAVCLLMTATRTQAAEIAAEKSADQVAVTIDGKPFTVLHHGKDQAKPYFWPVQAADGTVLTRPIIPGEKEHPHHKGIWISVDEVGESKHWMEREKIASHSVEVLPSDGKSVQIELRNRWLDKDGKPQLNEVTTVTIFPSRLMVFDIKFEAAQNEIEIGDTKEGLFGIRVAESMKEKNGGAILNADGKKGMKEAWGQPSKWGDYSGKVEGKDYGVTIFDSPSNFRPSRYHVRDYGLFTISPFGEGAYQNKSELAKPVHLKKGGDPLRLVYGLAVHDGAGDPAEISEVYEQFLSASKSK